MNRVSHEKKQLWLPWLTTRLVIFFFYMAAMTFLLSILGNFQNFSDSTQYFLFDLMKILFYVFFCTALLNIILTSFISVKRSKTGLFFYLRYVFMVIFIAILYFTVNFVFKFIETVQL